MGKKSEIESNTDTSKNSLPLFIKRGEFKKQVKSLTQKPKLRHILFYKRISSILILNKIDES